MSSIKTKAGKRKFIRDLNRMVTKTILSKIDLIPDTWDGFELRQYIADTYAYQTSPMDPSRIRAYKKTIATKNL